MGTFFVFLFFFFSYLLCTGHNKGSFSLLYSPLLKHKHRPIAVGAIDQHLKSLKLWDKMKQVWSFSKLMFSQNICLMHTLCNIIPNDLICFPHIRIYCRFISIWRQWQAEAHNKHMRNAFVLSLLFVLFLGFFLYSFSL